MFLRALAAGFLAALAQGCASTDTVADPLAGLRCAPFEWTALEGVSDRAALIVRGTVNGAPVRLQLDTAAGVSMLYGEASDWPEVSFSDVIGQGRLRIGDIDLGDTPLMTHSTDSEGDARGGTLGLAALIGKVIALDYPNRRICIAPTERAADALRRQASFVPAPIVRGKLWIPVEANGAVQEGFFFDTGASAFVLVTDLEQWRSLTGDTPATADRVIEVTSWGNAVQMRGSSAIGALRIAGVRLNDPPIYYMASAPTFFQDMSGQIGIPVQGLVGNAPFFEHVVVLDLVAPRPRFGVLLRS